MFTPYKNNRNHPHVRFSKYEKLCKLCGYSEGYHSAASNKCPKEYAFNVITESPIFYPEVINPNIKLL
jgi:hypothetical protein